MRKSGLSHTLHIRPVYVPGVGKRFALVEENGRKMKKLYKTFKAAQAGRYWVEVNSLVH